MPMAGQHTPRKAPQCPAPATYHAYHTQQQQQVPLFSHYAPTPTAGLLSCCRASSSCSRSTISSSAAGESQSASCAAAHIGGATAPCTLGDVNTSGAPSPLRTARRASGVVPVAGSKLLRVAFGAATSASVAPIRRRSIARATSSSMSALPNTSSRPARGGRNAPPRRVSIRPSLPSRRV